MTDKEIVAKNLGALQTVIEVSIDRTCRAEIAFRSVGLMFESLEFLVEDES